ncbi:histidine phosphatase family protein [Candidatus Saccharibacteria bacterium]|jgi:broad specificity phosphatase PhoE|nr:histidine phosphatase family protein [Candidatus Saccharibacteria bacterium]
MSIYIVRHGLSEANNRNNFGTPAFGNKSAPLMLEGRMAAARLNPLFKHTYNIDPATTPAATSELVRTQETARRAGFTALNSYAALNEVERGLTLDDKRAVRERGVIPREALDAAKELLDNPPTENIWFTHGLLIAGLCKHLGIYQDPKYRIIPHFCEIRQLPL